MLGGGLKKIAVIVVPKEKAPEKPKPKEPEKAKVEQPKATQKVAAVVGADQDVARIGGKWLITRAVAATPELTP